MIFNQLNFGLKSVFMWTGFSLLATCEMILFNLPPEFLPNIKIDGLAALSFSDTFLLSTVRTLLFAFGGAVVFRIWKNTINQSDYFRMTRRPFVIGISGDPDQARTRSQTLLKVCLASILHGFPVMIIIFGTGKADMASHDAPKPMLMI